MLRNIIRKSAKIFKYFREYASESGNLKLPNIDFNYLCDPRNTAEIRENIKSRKGVGDIVAFLKAYKDWQEIENKSNEIMFPQLVDMALKIPNSSHPDIKILSEPKVVKETGHPRSASFKMLKFEELSKKLNICRSDGISNFTGPRTYYFLERLAELEQALIQYALAELKNKDFNLISVPDILPRSVIEDCGMETRGKRNQVYSLDGEEDLCLSGTAEMGIAFYLKERVLRPQQLPLRLAAISRCFRAETSKTSEERGIYRVHQFTKLEMFGVSSPDSSDKLLNEFLQIQEGIFSSLGLALRVVDMPPCELGAQAHRKFDVEAWLPGKQLWGEISSASDCTDYQSRRLAITTEDGRYCHTVNGTACAAPRLILALLETHQNQDGTVQLPSALAPFLRNTLIQNNPAPKLSVYKERSGFG